MIVSARSVSKVLSVLSPQRQQGIVRAEPAASARYCPCWARSVSKVLSVLSPQRQQGIVRADAAG